MPETSYFGLSTKSAEEPQNRGKPTLRICHQMFYELCQPLAQVGYQLDMLPQFMVIAGLLIIEKPNI